MRVWMHAPDTRGVTTTVVRKYTRGTLEEHPTVPWAGAGAMSSRARSAALCVPRATLGEQGTESPVTFAVCPTLPWVDAEARVSSRTEAGAPLVDTLPWIHCTELAQPRLPML